MSKAESRLQFFQGMQKIAAKAEWMQKAEATPEAAWHELAASCAEDANKNNFASRRGTYVINDAPTTTRQVTCLYNNNPHKKPGHGNVIDHGRRGKEIEVFRLRMVDAGIDELGYATYPPPDHELAGYTYAMILDADESQTGIIHDAMKDAIREASDWAARFGNDYEGVATQDTVDDQIDSVPTVTVGVTSRITQSRVGQDAFSRAVRENYGHQCCFPGCDVDHDALLEAAHIARWADEAEFRGEISNGLCFCMLHHKAFDSGLFNLTDDFLVNVNPQQDATSTWVRVYLHQADGRQIRLGKIRPSLAAIRQHRNRHG